MKNLTLITSSLLIVGVFFITGCDDMTIKTGDGSEKMLGNGKSTSEKREITSFNQIEIEGVFNVFLSQKDRESVKIEAEGNIFPLVITSVENNVLTIKLKNNMSISKMKKINIYISLVDISKIKSEGVGILNCENKLKLKDLELNLNGVGASRLNIDVDKLIIKSELVGALILTGSAKEASIKHNGIGSFEAFELKTEKLNIETDGVGKAEVFASDELVIDAKGIGSVKYKGNPSIKHIKNEGVGSVECVN